ncbi:MAG: hypothetical protein SOX26_07405 [Phocaeicola sp.]|nr:hypothetical protein [Phocaeicola sp.]
MKSCNNGLSGLIRTRNEAKLLGPCIDSCIDALDELIVVYYDCTDETLQVLEEKKRLYPEKLKIYAYNHDVLSFDMTREEFEYTKTLPDDSPRLYCNLCNFGLSKMQYKYAMKIDADQIYFADEIKKWRDVCCGNNTVKWHYSFILGYIFTIYFSLYRRLSLKFNRPILWLLPNFLISFIIDKYLNLAKWKLLQGKVCIALSGVNLFKDDKWYIPFDKYNIHPPYNGEGDTVIFKLSEETYYSRRYSDKITYSCTELFHQPYKMMFAGPVWFHLHANRTYCVEKVRKVKKEHPELFVSVNDFLKMSYKDVLKKMDPQVNTLYQRILFALVHKMGLNTIRKHLPLLEKIKI